MKVGGSTITYTVNNKMYIVVKKLRNESTYISCLVQKSPSWPFLPVQMPHVPACTLHHKHVYNHDTSKMHTNYIRIICMHNY